MCSSSKGRKPLSRAYRRIPRLHTSALGPLYLRPWISSGEGRGGEEGGEGEGRGRDGREGEGEAGVEKGGEGGGDE